MKGYFLRMTHTLTHNTNIYLSMCFYCVINLYGLTKIFFYYNVQGVQGIYCAVSAVLLWVLLMYYRWNLSSYGFLGYKL